MFINLKKYSNLFIVFVVLLFFGALIFYGVLQSNFLLDIK